MNKMNDNQTACNFVIIDNAISEKSLSDMITNNGAHNFRYILNPIVENVNKNIFNFDLITSTEPDHPVELRPGDRDAFDWQNHGYIGIKDSAGFGGPTDQYWNKLTVLSMLSSAEYYEGGEISIIEPGQNIDSCIKTFKLEAGSVLIMPSFIQYRVNAVTSGIRLSVTSQYWGPRWK